MNFLIIASYPKSIYKFRGDLIRELKAKGFNVHIAAPFEDIDSNKSYIKNLEQLEVSLHSYPLNRRGLNLFQDLKSILSLCKIVFKISPDYVLSYTIKPVIYGTILSFIMRVPNRLALLTGLGSIFVNHKDLKDKYSKKIVTFLYKISLKLSTKIIFQNKDDKDLFVSLKIIQEDNRSYIVNGSGVNLNFYKKAPFPYSLRFLFIGRFLKSKGLMEYIEAAKIINSKNKNIKFAIAGSVEEGGDAISFNKIDILIKEGIIENLGYLDDVRPAIENSSVFVLPSYREGTPRSVLEAMAMGRAIITTKAPGCIETVEDGYNGYLTNVGSVGDIVKAIESFEEDPSLIDKMGRNSIKLVREKYDVKIINKNMIDIMDI
tara:strand:+ start:182 stop:1306 length:1125 start_codon:yes stop_codon:yes gene_type:complete